MAQYQTFPGIPGDSRTLDKLKALRLPTMAGKRFLDVGCNEGFFCGYAKFDGAIRSVGLDSSAEFIERAHRRFPDCEFLQQGWGSLPVGPFDVILLASALHYAEDQPGLIGALMERLAQDGVLVLELGIASHPDKAWVSVERGIDERIFPSMSMLDELLQGHAWKWIGPSVSQDGDPVGRHVVHVRRRRPVAYLLMQPPGYGKSTLAGGLFPGAGVPVVSGDQVLHDVAMAKLLAPDRLRDLVTEGFSPFAIDRTMERIFSAGLAADLVELWTAQAGPGDFALDVYVPDEHHDRVRTLLADRGYLPVQLRWEQVGDAPPSGDRTARQADAYHAALTASDGVGPARPGLSFQGTKGFVDELVVGDGYLSIRGWAVHESGAMPSILGLKLRGELRLIENFEKQQRPDVQKYAGLSHDVCGFRLTVPAPGARQGARYGGAVQLFGGNAPDRLDGPFPMSEAVTRELEQKSGGAR